MNPNFIYEIHCSESEMKVAGRRVPVYCSNCFFLIDMKALNFPTRHNEKSKKLKIKKSPTVSSEGKYLKQN